ncbi:uncharacterized protein LY89DRAFT_179638 [Mollisia scopiformis]|uniref:Uncharacterized protein n=1 Tax=Mollisia scopiformis TaxID=149040 RepID=A0A194XSQ5_MOLSC|nr:uncharacterized protein LY89DRAFT_179638 [Mollisia scopiformis]KUJ23335.1 hypothetical protein LY89DRAFT_179638 [Mollisia scopiformis]
MTVTRNDNWSRSETSMLNRLLSTSRANIPSKAISLQGKTLRDTDIPPNEQARSSQHKPKIHSTAIPKPGYPASNQGSSTLGGTPRNQDIHPSSSSKISRHTLSQHHHPQTQLPNPPHSTPTKIPNLHQLPPGTHTHIPTAAACTYTLTSVDLQGPEHRCGSFRNRNTVGIAPNTTGHDELAACFPMERFLPLCLPLT